MGETGETGEAVEERRLRMGQLVVEIVDGVDLAVRGLAIAVCDGTDDGGVRRYCYFNSGALPPRSSHDVYHVDDD